MGGLRVSTQPGWVSAGGDKALQERVKGRLNELDADVQLFLRESVRLELP